MKKLIRLTESDLHRIVIESVKRIIKENNQRHKKIIREFEDDERDFGQFGDYPPSMEDIEKESMIDCTFLINQNELILEPSGNVIKNDIPDDEWCSIEITPVFEKDINSLYVDDLNWEYCEVSAEMEKSMELKTMIDNAIEQHFDEICQKIYNTSPYS